MHVIVALISLYVGVAALTTGAAIRYSLRSRPRRYEPLDRLERTTLSATALVAGALWIFLLPVFLPGWLRTRVPPLVARIRSVRDRGLGYGRAARRRARRFFPAPHPSAGDQPLGGGRNG